MTITLDHFMQDQLTLAYLMCSKLCHDLAAPLGAISLGLEMLPDTNDPEATQNILKYSVQSAINKLELLRCISSYSSSLKKPVLSDVVTTINKSFDTKKIKIDWQCDIDDTINGNPVRLLSVLIALSLDALPRGGAITIHPDFSIKVSGSYIKFNDEAMSVLSSPTPIEKITPRAILGHLAYLLSRSLKTKILVATPDTDQVTFNFI